MRGIVPQHAKRLRLLLTLLDDIARAEEADLPGIGFHGLRGDRDGHFAVKVNGNWRIIFTLENEDVMLVDYLDYH
jgi:proteic killer suppression protein